MVRKTDKSEDEGYSDEEKSTPRLTDVYVKNTLYGLERWSWKEMQPLSLERSKVIERSRSCSVRNSDPDELRVSMILAIPSWSLRSRRIATAIAEAEATENIGALRELGTSDAALTKFDFMIGVGYFVRSFFLHFAFLLLPSLLRPSWQRRAHRLLAGVCDAKADALIVLGGEAARGESGPPDPAGRTASNCSFPPFPEGLRPTNKEYLVAPPSENQAGSLQDMTTAASSSSQPASLSRLARLKVNLGLKQLSHAGSARQNTRYTDENETEWYIPYNGPYELPKRAVGMGKVRERRDSWADIVASGERVHDPFERDVTVSGHGGASTSGHGHDFAYSSSAHGHVSSSRVIEEQARGREMSLASKYSESLASLGDGERRSQAAASPITSPISSRRRPLPAFLDLDAVGVGIGESPMPMQRVGHSSNSGHGHDPHEYSQAHAWPSSAPAPAASTRDSTSSFWTFGRSSKKIPPANVSITRPSVDSRPSTSTRQNMALGPVTVRDRSATVTGHVGELSNTRPSRPRANTSVSQAATAPGPSVTREVSDQPTYHRQYVDDRPEPDRAGSPLYQRHPYATAVSPTGHRLHSQIMPSAEKKQTSAQRRSPVPIINAPFLSTSKSFSSLRNTAKNLKTSVSTPNLRGERPRGGQASGGSSVNSPGTQSVASSGPKWLSPETWCDALLFPRPRFRLRSAHVISPPTSPLGITPPYSAPAQTQSQSRTLKRSLVGRKSSPNLHDGPHAPSSAPPVVSHPNPEPPPQPSRAPARTLAQPEAGPFQKSLHPPRPKSFAQDDLALLSPVPSLATVLRQNEEFEKERSEWKAKASRSFGNKRSRSLSRSRMKAKVKLNGKPSESESELAFSFDLIAATAFHGSQTLKPHVHYGPSTTGSGSRNGAGTNTTSTGLNTTSTHSRNTSNASKNATSQSIGHGHNRKESWSKSAIRTAKHTAQATGLCSDNDDLSPADEKVLAPDGKLQQDRARYVHLNPRDGRTGTDDDGVVVITAESSQYLNATQTNFVGPSLSPVPSDRSGGSTGVGIALSTPTVLVDHPFQFSDHPYASGPNPVEIPRPAEYAGPHPSRMAEFALTESSLNDVAARHRLPSAVVASRSYTETTAHPYAAAEQRSRPTLRVPVSSIPPPKKMFADVGTGSIREVLPDDIQYSPYSAQHSENSKHNSEALGVEEALNLAFSRKDSATDEKGGQVEGHTGDTEDFGSRTVDQELIVPALMRSAADYRVERMPQIDEGSMRESWQNSQDVDEHGHFLVPTPMSTISFKPKFSPAQTSLDSSPMTSPRQFKKFDDTEDYSDLFYTPGQPASVSGGLRAGGNSSESSGEPTPPNESTNPLNFREEEGFATRRPLLARSNSALTNLRRKLSEEYRTSIDDRHVFSEDVNLRRHVSDVPEVDEDFGDPNDIISQGSPPGASLPLRLGLTHSESPGPVHVIPEDVESSRASSVLERYETEEGTEVYYRVGEVPALATPNPVSSTHMYRASAHVSYIDSTPPSNHRSLSPDTRGRTDTPSRPSLQPQSATSMTRESYMTSTSSASRISQLSEFPVPPGQTSLTPGTIIQSYFGSTLEPTERHDPIQEDPESVEREQKRHERQSRRTTFGPVSDDEDG
ncbi:hypothetical protein A7U60_g2235 [Sanghuangporus baumii]|uniref:Uncharacterized protein n=1 Tax=Sanghuangporus baumii TaxID=108892 RepID=A0A9Q5N8E0_SANBA|nr:hypothetical protein A7U60_g2235 [Sanghuangporus baumii]